MEVYAEMLVGKKVLVLSIDCMLLYVDRCSQGCPPRQDQQVSLTLSHVSRRWPLLLFPEIKSKSNGLAILVVPEDNGRKSEKAMLERRSSMPINTAVSG